MNNEVKRAAHQLATVAQRFIKGATFQSYQPENLVDMQHSLDLSDSVIDWYCTAAPQNMDIPSFGNVSILLSPDSLERTLQEYRIDFGTGEIEESWNENWVVIGGEGQYPLIVQKAVVNDEMVYYGEPHQYSWRITPLSRDLEGFLWGLIDYIDLYWSKYGGIIYDADSVVLASFENDFTNLLNSRSSTMGLSQHWLKGWLGY